MFNDYNISIIEALKNRFSLFFSYKSNNMLYRIFYTAWMIVLGVPFLVASFLEFFILTAIKFIGRAGELIFSFLGMFSLIWFIPGAILGILYTILEYIFMALFFIFTLPNVLLE